MLHLLLSLLQVVNEPRDVHYPMVEMPTRSKLSCLSWNKYTKNLIASSDYDGIVTIWDVTTSRYSASPSFLLSSMRTTFSGSLISHAFIVINYIFLLSSVHWSPLTSLFSFQSVMEYEEHEKRAWSVDFSCTEPSMLVSGSDDCKVEWMFC